MSGYTLFISDLHLQQETPPITQAFIHFMQYEAIHAEALYILGDLFEAWIGDDDHTDFHQEIIALLKALTERGIPIYFMRGNRDFLLGKAFAKASGMQLLADPCLITPYGLRVLLSHGDLLCTLDQRHQKYRRLVLNPFCQKLLLMIPLQLRRKLAKKMRQQSQQHHRYAPSAISDVTESAVEKLLQQHNAPLLIHGHTHRPAIHKINHSRERIVLGAWHDEGHYLRLYQDGRYELSPLKKSASTATP